MHANSLQINYHIISLLIYTSSHGLGQLTAFIITHGWLVFTTYLLNNNNTYLRKTSSWQTKIKQDIAQCRPFISCKEYKKAQGLRFFGEGKGAVMLDYIFYGEPS